MGRETEAAGRAGRVKRRPHIEVYAVKFTRWDGDLEVTRSFVAGYGARCDCKAKGGVFDTWREARDWARDHAKTHAAGAVVAAPVKPAMLEAE